MLNRAGARIYNLERRRGIRAVDRQRSELAAMSMEQLQARVDFCKRELQEKHGFTEEQVAAIERQGMRQ